MLIERISVVLRRKSAKDCISNPSSLASRYMIGYFLEARVEPVVTSEHDCECMKGHDFISFIQKDEDHVLVLSGLPSQRPIW